MTFKETIEKLMEETRYIEVYACPSYEDGGKPCVGIRRNICGGAYPDPMIGDCLFMVAGNISGWTISDLEKSRKDMITIPLHAVYAWPYTEIDLGTYRVVHSEVIARENGENVMELWLSRKG